PARVARPPVPSAARPASSGSSLSDPDRVGRRAGESRGPGRPIVPRASARGSGGACAPWLPQQRPHRRRASLRRIASRPCLGRERGPGRARHTTRRPIHAPPSSRMNYELYGLRIGSDLPLNAPACRDGPVDLEVRWGEPLSTTPAPPAGRVLAHAVWGGGQGYTHTETPQGY